MSSVFFLLSKLVSFLLIPLIWIILLFILSLLKKNPSTKKKLFITGFVLLLLFTNPFLINVAMHSWEIPAMPSSEIKTMYDVAIIMGGSTKTFSNKTKRLTYSASVDRVLQTIDLYKKQKIKKILLSGGSGYVTLPDMKEAVLLKDVLLNMCIPDSDIIIENESRNTYENAKFTSTILKTGKYGNRFLLITTAVHIRRSVACFQKQNIAVDVYPVDERSGFEIVTPDSILIPNAWALTGWDALIHEWFGYVSYKCMGYA